MLSINITDNHGETFSSCVHLTSAIALILLADIDLAWDYISEQWDLVNPAVHKLKAHIESTWLYSDVTSLFTRAVWNHCGILRGQTNNAAEGFHSKLNKQLNKSNPSF